MFTNNLRYVLFVILALMVTNSVFADCPLAHTHIGVNPTWRPDWTDPGNPAAATDSDPTDDNKLWFFSVPPVHPLAPTPDWPQWGTEPGDSTKPFLKLTPKLIGGNKVYKPGDQSKSWYNCEFLYHKTEGYGSENGMQHLDGWHSAHGPQGKWNLESADEQTTPGWDIWIERVGTSLADSTDFAMQEGSYLTSDGDTYQLPKDWLPDKNAWGFHEHMSFDFWLSEDMLGDTVSVTFSAYDAGGMYDPSDDFTIDFEVIPEPATLGILAVGIGFLRRKKFSVR